MLKKLLVMNVLSFSTVLMAQVDPIIDWNAFEKDGYAVALNVLQGPINEKSALANCLAAAPRAVERFEAKGYTLSHVVCRPAGFPKSGYQVIVYKAE